MVSRTNLLLIGAAVLLLGVTSFRLRPKGGGVVPSDPIQDPNKIQITGLKQILASAQNIFKTTFKSPPKRSCGGVGQFSCGKLNFTPLPKGSRFSIDPFTGKRISIGQTFRGTPAGAAFFGGEAQLARNFQRVQQGNILKSDLSDFISNITNQIGLLEKPNNVTL